MLLAHFALSGKLIDLLSPESWPWPIFIWMAVGMLAGAIAGSLCHEDVGWMGYLLIPLSLALMAVFGINQVYGDYFQKADLVKLMLTGFFSVFFFVATFLGFFFWFHWRKYLKT